MYFGSLIIFREVKEGEKDNFMNFVENKDRHISLQVTVLWKNE